MNTRAILQKLTLAATVLSLSACLAGAPPRRGAVVYVSSGPPRAIVEVRGPAPSRAHVWIPGFYAWRGAAYVWVPGHFEVPPSGFRRWQPGKWQRERGGWFYIEGYWR